MALLGACASGVGGTSATTGARTVPKSWQERVIRVALATNATRAAVSADGDWRLFGEGGATVLSRSEKGVVWTIERSGNRLRAVRDRGMTTPWTSGPFVVSTVAENGAVQWDGRLYRGELWISPGDSGLRVINRVFIEDYLRSVVPAEIGPRPSAEVAAAQAQAVAARSYAYVRLGETANTSGWDVVSSVSDQVYRGVASERAVTDQAVASTAGLVIHYNGRAVSAPYSSTCGGMTAASEELYRGPAEPHLQRVSDRIPGTDRHYCEGSSRFTWTRTLDGATLDRAMATYLRRYARSGTGPVGAVRVVKVDGLTPSGRAAAIEVETERGTFHVRGNDTRFVLRPPNGEILNSTYFSVASRAQGGRVSSLTITGRGYGHGVGMCQWGAIGRARAGQDYREILRTYYPGTTLAQAR